MRVTKTRWVVGALALAVGLMLSVVGFARQEERQGPPAGGHGRGGPGGRGGGLGPLERELNLTDAQKAQIKQIKDSFRESTKGLHEQLFKQGGGPFDGLKDGAFDEAAARSAAQARANIQVELDVAHARMMSQIYALLTPEQKAKIAELRQQFKERRPMPPPPGAEDVPNI
jgi:periplasmic protein CpxP/Spy